MSFQLTQTDFIDLLRRTMDEDGWLEPILQHPDSRVILEAYIEQYVRTALAGSRSCDVGLITTAPAGVTGYSVIQVEKEGSISTVAGTLPVGTLFVDARGFLYQTLVDVSVPAGDTFSVGLNVVSLRETELVNTVNDPDMRFNIAFAVADATNATPIVLKTSVPHNFTTGDFVRVSGVEGNTAANGVFQITVIDDDEFELDGSVGNGDFIGTSGVVQPAPFTLIITEATPVTGGLSDYLAVLAAERGLMRQDNETDGNFRQRVLAIPDAVSPCAISDVVRATATNLGLANPRILEPFDLGETQSLKDDKLLGTLGNIFFDNGHFDDPINGQMNSVLDFTNHFLVTVASGTAAQASGSFFDSEKAFFDGLFFFDAFVQATLDSALAILRTEINLKRAHAVKFDLLLSDVIRLFTGQGDSTLAGAFETVFTLSPPAGKAWHLWHVLTSISAAVPPAAASTYEQTLRFVFDDASIFDLPIQVVEEGESVGALRFTITDLKNLPFPFKPIVSVQGRVKDDAVSVVRQVAHLWMVEFEL